IESSKSFARNLIAKYGIPGNPFFQRFAPKLGESIDAVLEDADAVLRQLGDHHVIKDDGLAGGKGVKVFGDHLESHADSLAFCRELLEAGHPFLIEEKLEGEEFSLLSFTDGTTLRHMPPVQDHKRAFDGDRGPNTGGMGSYTGADGLLPFLSLPDVLEAQAINERTIAALREECGLPYRGILYGGFMATRHGVRLIEHNARFGDPEALNLLTLLDTDLLDIFRAITNDTLAELHTSFLREASVCKYIVPEGYPDHPRKGDRVDLPSYLLQGASVFLSAVDVRAGELIATGSRTVAVVGRGQTIAEAESLCERFASMIPGPFFHRKDIGTADALARRVQHMRALRSLPS
ncbi:MAG: phosphoribosylamine--glycine ligase, partial [Janthinobacterium lividum]